MDKMLVIMDLILVVSVVTERLMALARRARAGEDITDEELAAAKAATDDAVSRWLQAAPHDKP